MPEIPSGYEACSVEECTHALLAGETEPREVYKFKGREVYVFVYPSCISRNAWDACLITPLRKVKPKPIEFESRVLYSEATLKHFCYSIGAIGCAHLEGKRVKVTVEVLD